MYDFTVNAEDVPWLDAELPGAQYKVLWTDPANGAHLMLYRFAPGCEVPAHTHTDAAETAYVLTGSFVEDGTTYAPGQSFYAQPGVVHGPHRTPQGATVLFHLSAPLDFNPASTQPLPTPAQDGRP